MDLDIYSPDSRCPHCYKRYQTKDDIDFLCCTNGHRWKIISTLDDNKLVDQLRQDYEVFLNIRFPQLSWLKRKTKNKRKLFTQYLYETQKNLFDIKPNIHQLIQQATNPK